MSICFTDQPPAYPSNDKPPEYHDVCPPKIVTPPPVNMPAPDDTPAARVPSPIINSSGITVQFPPSDNATPMHIPIDVIFNGLSQALNNNGTTTTTTTTTTANMRTPVLTQPPNVSSTINITFSARSHGMHNNSSTGTAENPIVTQPSNNSSTGYPPENIVITQPPTYNSHLYDAANVSESNT